MNRIIISILLLLLSLHAMAEAEADSIGVARNSIFDPPQEEQVFFYHKDHLGSTLCITDRNGQIVERSEYISYGEVFIDNVASDAEYETPYKFTGKETFADELKGIVSNILKRGYIQRNLQYMYMTRDRNNDRVVSSSVEGSKSW